MFNLIISILFIILLIINIGCNTKIKFFEKNKKNKIKSIIFIILIDILFVLGVFIANIIRFSMLLRG